MGSLALPQTVLVNADVRSASKLIVNKQGLWLSNEQTFIIVAQGATKMCCVKVGC